MFENRIGNGDFAQEAETQIKELLATATDSISLANKLFGPGGVFSQLARNEQERRALIATPLFKAAQRRLTELRRKDASAFAKAVDRFMQSGMGTGGMLKLERA
jgi:hypothetical protein